VSTDKCSSKKSTGRPTYSHLICYGKNGYVNRPVEVKVSRNKRKKELRAEHTRTKAEREVGSENGGTAVPAGCNVNDTLVPALQSTAFSCEAPANDVVSTETTVPTLHAAEAPNADSSAGPTESQLPYLRCSYRTSLFAVPDIFYRGEMLWPKGIGLDCCFVGVMFLKTVVQARGVIDPFAGQVR
jgi:hypothetical protein